MEMGTVMMITTMKPASSMVGTAVFLIQIIVLSVLAIAKILSLLEMVSAMMRQTLLSVIMMTKNVVDQTFLVSDITFTAMLVIQLILHPQ